MNAARRSIFVAHRAALPSARAASLQVALAAHAFAARGHSVELPIEPLGPNAWASLRLRNAECLRPRVLSGSRTVASVQFRWWLRRAQRRGDLIWVRSWRYADELLARGGQRFVFEAHEVPSATEPADRTAAAREARVLAAAAALVCNAPGTFQLLAERHRRLPPSLVAHNATLEGRVRRLPPGKGIGYVGSVRAAKDLDTLAAAAALLDEPVTIVGAEADACAAVPGLVGSRLRLLPAIPWADVPDVLAGFAVLVLPLSHGPFGDALTSPLKLWDYLASGVPIVGADTDALRAAAPGMYRPYRPGDPSDLAAAIRASLSDPSAHRRARDVPVRTWDARAAEIEAFLDGVAL